MSTIKTEIPLNNINMLSKEDFDNVNFEEHPNELFYTLDEIDVIYSDVDAQLSDISENPVQNKVITNALNDKVSNENISLDANAFAESERQKSKNLFDINNVKNYIGNVVTSVNGNEITISNSTGWGQVSYLIDVKPNTDYVLSVQDINVITQSNGTGKIGIYRGSNNSYITELYATERTRTFNSGAETQITVYLTSTAWGVEGSGEAKYTGIQIEEGTVATDYQPYNGAIVREKQLKEAVEKRELFYDVLNNRIDITSSTLTTLQAYFDLFKSDTSKTYSCNIGALETSKFKDLLPDIGFGNYCTCFIKYYSSEMWSNGNLKAFEIIAFSQFGSDFAKGYLYKNLNGTIVFTGWTKIGG